MNDDLIIDVEQQTVYKTRNKGEWADITVKSGSTDSELSGGRNSGWVKVGIQSSYGAYGHFWNSIGPGHWSNFLNGLDIEYALNKLMIQKELYEFDMEKSVKGMRQHIIEIRKWGDIDREEARIAWNAVSDMEHSNNEHAFLEGAYHIDVFRDDYYEWSRKSMSAAAVGFWNRLWRPWIMTVTNTVELRNAA